jgi:vacuolar-type H+-ATPase subunit I/STV1
MTDKPIEIKDLVKKPALKKTPQVCGSGKCLFDPAKYSKTLERFDKKIDETEKRLQDQINEMKERLKDIEQTVPEKRLHVLEEAVLEFLPQQKTLLTQLKDGQDALQRSIGGLSERIQEHENKLMEHGERITALQSATDRDSVRLSAMKHDQWMDRFKLCFGSFLLTVWAADMLVIRRMFTSVNPTAEPTWYGWVVLSVVVYIFGESALKKGISTLRESATPIDRGNGQKGI